MKKRLIIIALLVCVAVVAAVIVKREFFPAPGVTVQNFKRLHNGLSRAEVEQILGRKPDELSIGFAGRGDSIQYPARWIGNLCEVQIFFSTEAGMIDWDTSRPDDQPIWGGCYSAGVLRLELAKQPPPLLDRIRIWLGI